MNTTRIPASNHLLFIFAAFIISRIAMQLAGFTALQFHEGQYALYTGDIGAHLGIWGAWDTQWYVGLLENGYDLTVSDKPGTVGQANWAFFPLYPAVGWVISQITGLSGFTSLLVVSNFAFVAALVLINRETKELYGPDQAKIAVVITCIFPGTHFFSSAYSESLFLLLVVASMRHARLNNIMLAGFFAGLASLTRNTGVLLAVPIFIYAVAYGPRPDGNLWQSFKKFFFSTQMQRLCGAGLMVSIPLAAFLIYLWNHTGDPFSFITVQSAWKREFINPLATLFYPLFNLGLVQNELLINIPATWLSVIGTIYLFHQRNFAHGGYMLAAVIVALSAGLLSYFRFLIVMAPLIWLAADIFGRIGLIPRMLLLTALFAVELFLMAGWAVEIGIY